MEKKREYVCCFCGKKEKGYGNNPAPVYMKEGARCCSKCNMAVVVPMRLALISFGKRGGKC